MSLPRIAARMLTRRIERRLMRPNGAIERGAAIIGLVKAIAEGLAEEVQSRINPCPQEEEVQPAPRPAPVSAPVAAPSPKAVAEPAAAPAPSPWDGMTVVALKDEAHRRGIAVPRRIKKADLIALLEA